jgi:Ca2+-binding RTX toxin-like protein
MLSRICNFVQSAVEAVNASVNSPKKRRRAESQKASESLEARRVPAAVVNGNLQIVGSNYVDNVQVNDVTIGSTQYLKVQHNGSTQYFFRSSVYGQIQFWGYGGNDSFNYNGSKNVYAHGGDGNDFLSSDRGNDLLVGGNGHDTLEGWSGNDELQGGWGNDLLDGGWGNDLLFGQEGNDLLGGGAGDDRLVGGTGLDVAFGGAGADQFWEINTDYRYAFTYAVSTRFGWQYYSAGIQDFGSGDRAWS